MRQRRRGSLSIKSRIWPRIRREKLGGFFFAGVDGSAQFADFARDSDPAQHLHSVVGEVHFPPANSLPTGVHELVVIVVPAFAESDQSENKIVAAVIFCLEAARAPNVRQRIDAERAVIQQHR